MTYPADESFRKSSYSNGPNTACVEVAYRKSSYSNGANTSCVEVGSAAGTFHVRDSKDKTGPVLSFGTSDWTAFVDTFARPER